jgi:hypothetical protein
MRTLCIILTVVLTSLTAYCADTVTTSNALCFFVVSEKPIGGGRYIDTPDFPKVGYISNSPGFVLTKLQKVWTNEVTLGTNTVPTVTIKMFQTDGESFAAFTQQNINRKLLLVLRDKPLIAATVKAPIEAGSLELDGRLPFSVVEDIQRLVQH